MKLDFKTCKRNCFTNSKIQFPNCTYLYFLLSGNRAHPDKFLFCHKVYYLQNGELIEPTKNFEKVCASDPTQKVSINVSDNAFVAVFDVLQSCESFDFPVNDDNYPLTSSDTVTRITHM